MHSHRSKIQLWAFGSKTLVLFFYILSCVCETKLSLCSLGGRHCSRHWEHKDLVPDLTKLKTRHTDTGSPAARHASLSPFPLRVGSLTGTEHNVLESFFPPRNVFPAFSHVRKHRFTISFQGLHSVLFWECARAI